MPPTPPLRSLCLTKRPNMDRTPGAVGTCLAGILEQLAAAEGASRKSGPAGTDAPPQLSDSCRAMADVAEPPDVRAAFDTSLTFALVQVRCAAGHGSATVPLLACCARRSAVLQVARHHAHSVLLWVLVAQRSTAMHVACNMCRLCLLVSHCSCRRSCTLPPVHHEPCHLVQQQAQWHARPWPAHCPC